MIKFKPWHVRTLDQSIGSIDDSDDNAVAQAFETERGNHELRRAHAHLIAAAPDMFNALDKAIEVMQFAYMNAPEQPKEIALAQAALAKALGK